MTNQLNQWPAQSPAQGSKATTSSAARALKRSLSRACFGALLVFVAKSPCLAEETFSLGIIRTPTNSVLNWTNPAAVLESSLSLTGAWMQVTGAVSPYSVEMTNEAAFFRLRST